MNQSGMLDAPARPAPPAVQPSDQARPLPEAAAVAPLERREAPRRDQPHASPASSARRPAAAKRRRTPASPGRRSTSGASTLCKPPAPIDAQPARTAAPSSDHCSSERAHRVDRRLPEEVAERRGARRRPAPAAASDSSDHLADAGSRRPRARTNRAARAHRVSGGSASRAGGNGHAVECSGRCQFVTVSPHAASARRPAALVPRRPLPIISAMLQLHSTTLLVAVSRPSWRSPASRRRRSALRQQPAPRRLRGGSSPTLGLAAALALHAVDRPGAICARRSPPCSPCSGRSSRWSACAASTRAAARASPPGPTASSSASSLLVVRRRLGRADRATRVQAQVYVVGACSSSTRVRRRSPSARLEDFATTLDPARRCASPWSAARCVQAAWLAVASPSCGPPSAGRRRRPSARCSRRPSLALLMTQLALVMNHERNVAQLRASHRKLRHLVEVDTADPAAEPAPLPRARRARRSRPRATRRR